MSRAFLEWANCLTFWRKSGGAGTYPPVVVVVVVVCQMLESLRDVDIRICQEEQLTFTQDWFDQECSDIIFV